MLIRSPYLPKKLIALRIIREAVLSLKGQRSKSHDDRVKLKELIIKVYRVNHIDYIQIQSTPCSFVSEFEILTSATVHRSTRNHNENF